MSVADEVHVFANVTAAPGKADELRSVLKDLVAATHTEPGVLTYILHEEPKKPGNFYVFEVYKDQAAADSHMKSPHLATAFAKAGALLSAAPSIVETKVVAGA
jgi:quinol monooxygenase YgiN